MFLRRFFFVVAMFIFSISVFAQGHKYNLEEIKKNSQKKIGIIKEKLRKIERQKEQAKKAGEIKEIFNQAEKLYKEGKLKEAKELYQKAYQLSDDDSMQSYIRRVNREVAKRRQRRRERIKSLYSQAKQAYSEDNLNRSEEIFKQILEIDSSYNPAQTYINTYIPKKRKQLKKQARQEKINDLYHQGKVDYSRRKIDKAKKAFKQILEIAPNHRAAKIYLEEKIPNLVEHITELAKKEKIENIYREGEKLYSKKLYKPATAKFKKILKLDPENKYALKYLEVISEQTKNKR